jgi:hypothetical protein
MVIDEQLSSRRRLARALTDSGFAVVGGRNTWSERGARE